MLKWEDAEKLEELLEADRYPSKEWKAASLPGRVEWLQKECKKLSDMCIEKNNILIKIYSEQLQKDEEELVHMQSAQEQLKDKLSDGLRLRYGESIEGIEPIVKHLREKIYGMDNELLERLKNEL